MFEAISTSGAELNRLLEILQNSWNFDNDELHKAKQKLEEQDWDASSLTLAYLNARIQGSFPDRDLSYDMPEGVPTLVDIAAGKLSNELASSQDLHADLDTMDNALPSSLMKVVLASAPVTYPVLRERFNRAVCDPEALSKWPDIDEAVLRNSQYIRSRSDEANEDGKYLVRIEALITILGGSPRVDILEFQRKQPSKGGFEFLDAKRRRSIKILANSAAFQKAFNRITYRALKGLNWDNILIGGEMTLPTLMCTNASAKVASIRKSATIDVYIYGLNAVEANAKIRHIYDVWSGNLPRRSEKMVSKTRNQFCSAPNGLIATLRSLSSFIILRRMCSRPLI